jgi:hypothetical protein
MDVTIVDPPKGSIVGGGLVELSVLPSPEAATPDGWTLCAQASDLANTSCIVCEPLAAQNASASAACNIEVATGEMGVIEPRVWAASTIDTTVDQLRGLVTGPSSAQTQLGVLVSTPIEVFRLGLTDVWQRPFETSKSWWGRSTAPALTNAMVAAQDAELLAEPAAHGPIPAPASPPLALRRHATFLGASLPAEAAPRKLPTRSEQRVLVAVVAGARAAEVVDASLASLHSSLGGTRGLDILFMSYDGTDWEGVARQGAERRAAAGGRSASADLWTEEATFVKRKNHMKWWFVKRFVSPALASSGAYGWVLVLDEDALLTPSFDADGFFSTLELHGAKMGQPMHADASETSFGFLQESGAKHMAESEGAGWQGGNTIDGIAIRMAEKDSQDSSAGNEVGVPDLLWVTMVECGPVTAFRADAWACVWDLLQSDLTSGFGYDLVWASRCARDAEGISQQAGPGIRAAVTLHHRLEHTDLGTASSVHAGFFRRAVGEGLVLFERLRAQAAEAVQVTAQDEDRVFLAGEEPKSPADASELLRKALDVDQVMGVMPMEPRVIGVGRRAEL